MGNKTATIIVSIVMMSCVLLFSALCVREAQSGTVYRFMWGKSAKLRNTIELSVNEAETLSVIYGSQNVLVYPADGDRIVIREYLYTDRQEEFAAVSHTGNAETVVTGSKTNGLWFLGMGRYERIEVYLPQGIRNLHIQTESGNINSESGYSFLGEELSVKVGSGNLNFQSAHAQTIYMKAGSGNLRLEELSGDMTLEAGSGNITAEALSGRVDAHVGSGNIRLTLSEVSESLRVQSGSGNVSITLPEETKGQIRISTKSGNIHTDFDDSLSFNQKGNQAEGVLGEKGDFKLEAEAGSGNVKVLLQ